MITLFTFGPGFGLPDPSPFVVKAMLLLKFAGLPYAEKRGNLFKAPKGKLPYIVDDGLAISDSTFIRFHIETKYGFDFDAGLSPSEKANAWALEKMCEDHLYWTLVDLRWCDDANFEKYAAYLFGGVPMLVRPLVATLVRRKVAASLRAQGIGRHTKAEIIRLAIRDIEAIADSLGDKPFLTGDKPRGVDAACFGFVSGVLSPFFDSPIRTAAEDRKNLVNYCERISSLYFTRMSA
jgi:glutathione S-transferase